MSFERNLVPGHEFRNGLGVCEKTGERAGIHGFNAEEHVSWVLGIMVLMDLINRSRIPLYGVVNVS